MAGREQLLQKNLGEQISLMIPSGILQVTIKDISYIGYMLNPDVRKKA